MTEPRISIIDLNARQITLDDGKTLPIEHFYFTEDAESDDPREAVMFIAGKGSTWLCVEMEQVAHLIRLGEVAPLSADEWETA